MQECFYYDAFMLKITECKTIIKTYSEDDYNKGVYENHYKTVKILLSNILATIMKSEIVKIWQIVVSCEIKNHYVILISNGSHRYTCNLLIIHEYPCRHFYKILKTSLNAKWHVSSISFYSNTSDNEIISGAINFNLGHITKVRGAELYTLNLQKLNNNHIKYGYAHGMIKKAIDLIFSINLYEEFIGMCQDFLERPAEKMKSAVKIQDKKSRRNYLRFIDLNILKDGNET
ncbi:hypothetical protein GLOIN_2v1794311 [Rhizophagus clarus]|uniref:SWIM-type domain-containing protein n=1 Tax=Rhizophagus clarus TaxID=94130 RepID=A0A8H3QRP5_9GLOM|nr:hypothetical protein GLOIN_2v1794311 [Rhizophagus clarus]